VDGNLKEEYKKFSLRTLMSRCSDFEQEQSAMENLFSKLSNKGTPDLNMLTSPKYHCELAGEGVEYCWGMAKRFYRNIPLSDKKTKQQFESCVRKSILYVKIRNVTRFSAKCRRYMMKYRRHNENTQNDELSYENIEKFVKKIKTHRNVADLDRTYIEKEWLESIEIK